MLSLQTHLPIHSPVQYQRRHHNHTTTPTQNKPKAGSPRVTNKIYSHADVFVEININDTITINDTTIVRGVVGHVVHTYFGTVAFTLSEKGKSIFCTVDTKNYCYKEGETLTVTGKYLTTKVFEAATGIKLSEQNFPIIQLK